MSIKDSKEVKIMCNEGKDQTIKQPLKSQNNEQRRIKFKPIL